MDGLSFNIVSNQLGGVLLQDDSVSGIVLNRTSGINGYFTGSNACRKINSYSEAYALGIVDDYTDATPSSATITANTTAGTAGSFTITFSGALARTITIPVPDADIYGNVVAYVFGGLINNLSQYGYRIVMNSYSSGLITIYAPQSFGTAANGVTMTIGGANVINIKSQTAFSGGTNSLEYHNAYIIKRFYEVSPGSDLWLTYRTGTSFSEVTLLQTYAQGKIKQIGLDEGYRAYAISNYSALKSVLTNLEIAKQFTVVIVGAKLTSLTNVDDASSLDAKNIAFVVSKSINDETSTLERLAYPISHFSTILGKLAQTGVGTSYAWVAQGDVSFAKNVELAFTDGTLYVNAQNQLTGLKTNRMTFLRKYSGLVGSFPDNSYSATSTASDFNSINRTKALYKAMSLTDVVLKPTLNAPLKLSTGGKLSPDVAVDFENTVKNQLQGMLNRNEISAFLVTIDPNQNILVTNTLIVQVSIMPLGQNEFIVVQIGFAVIQ